MYIRVVALIFLGGLGLSCNEQKSNPFLTEFDTPFGVPPFELIKPGHYLAAFEEGIQQQSKEIEGIVSNPEAPSFQNTVEALELSGGLLTKVVRVFFNMNSAHTGDELQEIAKQVAPMLSEHRDNILLNPDLFGRIETVFESREDLNLTPEQNRLLEETYKDFVRGGARLTEEEKAELRKANERLSLLAVTFGEHVLKENNAFELVLEDESDLSGLPDAVISAAAEAAEERGQAGKWVFTLHKPSLIPFLQFSDRRDLREKMFKAYINRGDHGNTLDNKEIVSEIALLRLKRARLLGYDSHADYVLERNMAKTPQAVYGFLDQLWSPALEMAKKERILLQEKIRSEGEDFDLAPWDWWYYTEKIREEEFELDEEALRPYFKLENVRDGAFAVASKLYGLSFEERTDIPKYHEDVRSFEVKEEDGTHIGILYVDYFPRSSKRGGAWMNSYRKESRVNGDTVTPVISNVCNFSKPTAGRPALLSLEEVDTLFHEFGHALHGLLSECVYDSLSGTDVPRDFVELPSQIMENWATHPDVMRMYARHYETGEVIPDHLIEKIKAAEHFNQGFATMEYLAASYLDLDWHTLDAEEAQDVNEFERVSLDRIGLIPEIVVRYRSPYFSHIFSGGYAAGYYSYIWAEVLDADAFRAFEETGLFNQESASSFRRNILATGGSEDPAELYRRFRGSDPQIEALLTRRGFN